MYDRFVIVFSFLLLLLHISEHSLFSRFRNPNEFVAPADTLAPDDLDADTYADLLEEIPELRRHMQRPRPRDPLRMPYLKNNFEPSDQYDFMMDGSALHENFTEVIPTTRSPWGGSTGTSNATTSASAMDNRTASNSSDARRFFWWSNYWKGPRKATCYCCNLNAHRHIPVGSLCHDAWESSDWQARTMARYFRCHCYRNLYHWGSKIETKWKNKRHHKYDRGLFRGFYGPYFGGCFNRFLDVGKV